MKKIINTYRRYEHLSDFHTPDFTSNTSEFHVILWNLNYKGKVMKELTPDNIPLIQKFVKDNDEVVVKEFVKASRQIYKLISQNPQISAVQMSESLGLSARQVQKYLKRLQDLKKNNSCRRA